MQIDTVVFRMSMAFSSADDVVFITILALSSTGAVVFTRAIECRCCHFRNDSGILEWQIPLFLL